MPKINGFGLSAALDYADLLESDCAFGVHLGRFSRLGVTRVTDPGWGLLLGASRNELSSQGHVGHGHCVRRNRCALGNGSSLAALDLISCFSRWLVGMVGEKGTKEGCVVKLVLKC